MSSLLKLEEIIWEITRKCNKNCKYCGSKDVIEKENPLDSVILHIAEEIAAYKVQIVTLSGGEPGLLSAPVLCQVVEILKNATCDIRAITNGVLLSSWSKEFLSNFDVIGYSINYPEDFDPDLLQKHNNITMITNFGTHNIWFFDQLAEIARSFKCWQIQLTTGGEFLLAPEGIEYLTNKIKQLSKDISPLSGNVRQIDSSKTKILIADDLQEEHCCSAGINSCGITAEGFVIPCLSERACYGNTEIDIQGDLFINNSLAEIWENGFKEIRFGEDGWKHTCRKCIKYPEKKENPARQKKDSVAINWYPKDDGSKPWEEYRITLYGCGDPDRTVVYGVGIGDSQYNKWITRTIAYGVSNDGGSGGIC
jgi:MoaA/NifB/PqqE/SkfB family radical SAM enzyme